MARPPKPYFWKARGGWYCTVGGERHRLAEGAGPEAKAEATREFHRIMAGSGRARPDGKLTVALAASLFLDHAERETAPATYEQYRIKLKSFVLMFGTMKLRDVRPSHVSRWVASKDWSQATRRGAITYLKLMGEHAAREGLIEASPFAGIERPAMTRRSKTLSGAERATILEGSTDEAFRDFLRAMTETGARPGEIARLEASHIDWEAGTATMAGKTTAATGRDRTITLTRSLLAMLRRLAEVNPTGPLLRNSDGNPWTTNAVRCRFRRMRDRLGLDPKTVAYSYRHSFVTDGLERGVSPAAMAELVGHSGLKMVSEVYNHLRERREHLRGEAERAAGVKPDPSRGP